MQNNLQKIIDEMTLEEKASIVCGATFFGTREIERLGILPLQLLDGGTGINFEQLFRDKFALLENVEGLEGECLDHVTTYFFEPDKLNETERNLREKIAGIVYEKFSEIYAPACFPPGILLGSTFDPKTIYKVGVALGNEAKAFGVDILLGTPNVNILRDPRNGRIFEGYSEDPCLVVALSKELVKGVQSTNIAANVKHFAANNQETNRVGIDEIISKRALREIYFPGFEACVKEGKVKTLMSAYNRINGVPCTENSWMLTDILREEWGFDGMVVSDWGAVYHPVSAVQAGNDLAMPGPIDGQPIVDAVKNGELSEDVLDRSVLRILGIKKQDGNSTLDLDKLYKDSKKAAYEAAKEGIILLKNDNNMFPITIKDTLKEEIPKEETYNQQQNNGSHNKIAVLGSGAEKLLDCGSGSARIVTNRTSDFVTYMKKELGEDTILTYNKEQHLSSIEEWKHWLTSNQVTKVLVIISENGMEGNDRDNIFINPMDDNVVKTLIQIKQQMMQKYKKLPFQLGLLLNVCGPVDISAYEKDVDGIFCMFLPGMEGGHALADLVLGKVCPSGKLPLTFPKRYEDTPTMLNFPGDGYTVHYGEGIYVGYRYYDKKKIKPLYYFGHGLSYTTFKIRDLQVKQETFSDTLECDLEIENTGTMRGAEVIQLYIHDPYATLPKPDKELKAFQKIWLDPGCKERVHFQLEKKAFASFDTDYDKWIAEEGYYDIIIATSANPASIRLVKRVYLENKTEYSYGLSSTIKTFMEHGKLKDIFHAFCCKVNLDWQSVLYTYQYTPNTTIESLLTAQGKCQHKGEIKVFLNEVNNVKKQ